MYHRFLGSLKKLNINEYQTSRQYKSQSNLSLFENEIACRSGFRPERRHWWLEESFHRRNEQRVGSLDRRKLERIRSKNDFWTLGILFLSLLYLVKDVTKISTNKLNSLIFTFNFYFTTCFNPKTGSSSRNFTF